MTDIEHSDYAGITIANAHEQEQMHLMTTPTLISYAACYGTLMSDPHFLLGANTVNLRFSRFSATANMPGIRGDLELAFLFAA